MSELFVQIAVSLDGYIEDAAGDIGWMVDDGSQAAYATGTLQSIDAMIFGRKSYSMMAAYWPSAAEQPGVRPDHIEQARLMNTLPRYVLTTGAMQTGWRGSRAVRLNEIAALKLAASRPIALFAGAGAIQSAFAAGLVDELRLIVCPVLLGGGKSLFAAGRPRTALKLVEHFAFNSGATLSRYKVRT